MNAGEFPLPSQADDGRRLLAQVQGGVWKVLLPATARNRMLYLAPPSGGEALALAPWCRELVVATASAAQGASLLEWAGSLGVDNVDTTTIDELGAIPGLFDAIVVTSALIEPLLLRLLARRLAPNGLLLLVADNRWAYNRLGEPHHPGECGSKAYRRLLTKAGLSHALFYSGLPDLLAPQEFIRLDQPAAIFRAGTRSGSLKAAIKRKLSQTRLFAPSYAIVASREPAQRSWIEDLVRHIDSALALNLPPGRLPRMLVSNAAAAGLLLFIDERVVVRLALDPASECRVRRNFEGLQLAGTELAATIPVRTPAPLLLDVFQGVAFSVESQIPGRMVDQLPASSAAEIDARMFDLLMLLQARTHVDGDRARVWIELVVAPLQHAKRWTRTATQRQLLSDLVRRAKDEGPGELPLALSHGDFKWSNMLHAGPLDPLGLFDWDMFQRENFSSIDFCHFVLHRRRRNGVPTLTEAFACWVEGSGADAIEEAWTKRFVTGSRLGADWRRTAALAYMAREFGQRVGAAFDLDQAWIERNFWQPLPRLHAAICGRTGHAV